MVVVVVEQTSCCTGFLVRYSGDDDVDDDVEDCFLTCFFLCGLHDFWGAQADLVPWLVLLPFFGTTFGDGRCTFKNWQTYEYEYIYIHIIYVSSMFLVHVGIDICGYTVYGDSWFSLPSKGHIDIQPLQTTSKSALGLVLEWVFSTYIWLIFMLKV